MNTSHKLLVAIAGFAGGVATVLSCGDETPAHVDAATSCDCPISEAPLAGRIVHLTKQQEFASMMLTNIIVSCELGSKALSGGCLSNSNDSKYVLNSSFPFFPTLNGIPEGWSCVFYNGTAAPVTSTAYVTCLKPAP
jgi:hypothetical protein